MANNSFMITELDFDLIKNNFITYLQNQTVFSDYNFTGSGMNVLIDMLVKNTQYNAYYLNAIANEAFLDSAVIRDSLVSRAKELGYVPSSRRSGVANVAITVTPPAGNTVSSVVLPKYFNFVSEAIDGVNYTFVTDQAYVANKNLSSNTFTFPSVTLYQGDHQTFNYTVSPQSLKSVFPVPSANVDTTTLSVTIQNSVVDTNTEIYLQNSDITNLNSNSQIYFLEAMAGGLYGIYFGDNYLGKQLSNGNIIIVDYIDTDGEAANRANTFTPTGPIFGFANVQVNTTAFAAGGAEVASNETIRFRAPKAYTRQNRDVTTDDYTFSISDLYPNIESVSVWGGDQNDPPVYGKVFLSIKPKAGFALSNVEKQRIIDDLISNRNVVTVTPEIVDPSYIFVLINTSVYFDPNKTSKTEVEIAQLVRASLESYNSNNLGKFTSTVAFSEIQEVIDDSDRSIRNNDLIINIQKQFVPTLNTSLNYTLEFNTPLHRGGGTNDRLVTYPSVSLLDSQGIPHDSYVEEVPFSFSGVESIAMVNPGSLYTSTPQVFIDGDGFGATAVATIQNGRVIGVQVIDSGTEYTLATARFVGGGGTGAVATPVLSQRNGTLRSFYYKDNGQKVILNTSAGTIDYLLGTVTLINFNPSSVAVNPFYTSGVLVMTGQPDSQTITQKGNRIMTVDTTNPIAIQVNVERI